MTIYTARDGLDVAGLFPALWRGVGLCGAVSVFVPGGAGGRADSTRLFASRFDACCWFSRCPSSGNRISSPARSAQASGRLGFFIRVSGVGSSFGGVGVIAAKSYVSLGGFALSR